MVRIRMGPAPGSGVGRGWAHPGILKAIDRPGIAPDVAAVERAVPEIRDAIAVSTSIHGQAGTTAVKSCAGTAYMTYKYSGGAEKTVAAAL